MQPQCTAINLCRKVHLRSTDVGRQMFTVISSSFLSSWQSHSAVWPENLCVTNTWHAFKDIKLLTIVHTAPQRSQAVIHVLFACIWPDQVIDTQACKIGLWMLICFNNASWTDAFGTAWPEATLYAFLLPLRQIFVVFPLFIISFVYI